MKKKSIKKNYIYNLVYQLLTIITPIITTPYLARSLGPGGNGIYGYTVSIVTYFILFGSLGINLYAQREIAYVQDDMNKKSKIFMEIFILKSITLAISMVLYYFIFCLNGEYSIYFKILLLEIIANILDIGWFYSGIEEFKSISIRNIIIKIMTVIMILVFIKNAGDVGKYVFIYSFSTLASSLILWLNIKKHLFFTIKKLDIKRHIKPTIILFIPQIASSLYSVLDKTMIGSILNNMNEVGYYEQAQKVIRLLLTIITSVGTVMLPRIAKEFADKNTKVINAYMKKSFNLVLLLSMPLILGIVAVSKNFVPLFFGAGYEKVIPILSLMSIIILFIGFSSIIGIQYLLPLKKEKEFTISVFGGAIINLIANFILISKFKSIGACIGTILAELSVTTIQLYFVKNNFKLRELFKLSINYIFAGIIMFGACYLVDGLITVRLLNLALQVGVGIITYFTTLIMIRDKFVIYYLQFIINKIKKVKQ